MQKLDWNGAPRAAAFAEPSERSLKTKRKSFRRAEVAGARRSEGSPDLLERPAAGNQLNDQDHHSDYQQNVDEAAGDVEAKAKQPEDEKDYKNRPKHARSPLMFFKRPCGRRAVQGPA